MNKQYPLSAMAIAILIGMISISLVSAQDPLTYTIDFEGLNEGQIVESVTCGAGISCPSGSPDVTVLVNGSNSIPANAGQNTAMIFDAECFPPGRTREGNRNNCTGGDKDLFFPGHGNTLINSENLDPSNPDDQDEDQSFVEFDFSGFTGTVTIDSIDVGDVEEEEGEARDAFINFHPGSCSEREALGTIFDILPTGNNVIKTITIGASAGIQDAQCVQVRLNGSGTIDDIRFTVGPTPAPAIDIEKATNDRDADNPNDAPQIPVGGDVAWTYEVKNTGNVSLSSIVVTDDQGVSVSCPATTLDPGDSMTCTAGGTAVNLNTNPSNATIVQGCGADRPTYKNVGTVEALVEGTSTQVTDSDPSHYCNRPGEPGIDIEKTTNDRDADNPNDGPQIAVGGEVIWSYTVTNTGGVPLTNVDVVDDNGTPGNPGGQDNDEFRPTLDPSSDTNSDRVLDVGETWLYMASAEALDLSSAKSTVDACGLPNWPHYKNLGKVTAQDAAGNTVEDVDPSHYCNPRGEPSIKIEKATNGVDADNPNDAPQIPVGGTVTWTYEVTNTGNVPLTKVVVIDDNGCPGNTCKDFGHFRPTFNPQSDLKRDEVLEPGETWTYLADFHQAMDLNNAPAGLTKVRGCEPGRNTYKNLGKVTAQDAAGKTVNNVDPSHYCNPPIGPSPGRITGGGWRVIGSERQSVRSNGGFTLHCDITLSNNLNINWGRGNKWHIAKFVDAAFCYDDDRYTPEPPKAPADTYVGLDVGRLNNKQGSVACFRLEDHGERSRDPDGPDRALIRIWEVGYDPKITADDLDDPGFACLSGDSDDPTTDPNTVLYVPLSDLKGGNFQFHFDQPHKGKK